MALTDMSKECKHLRSTGTNEVFIPGTRRAQQIIDKGFRCEIGKFGPHLCGPKRCDPRKRDCFVERTEEDENAEEAAEATPAEEPKDEAKTEE
jgi:hypothetical protein